MDIAPTILDYIDVEQPDWMVGQSLISEHIIENPIISLSVINKTKGESIDYDSITPPFYQFGWIAIIICDNYYWLDLSDYNFTISKTDRLDDLCLAQPKDDLEVIKLLIDHLESYRFDTSSLLEHFSIEIIN